MGYITGGIRWADTHTTANLNATCPIRVTVLVSGDLGPTKVDCSYPCSEEPGAQSFIYKWGQSAAQVGDHTVEVSYGPTGGNIAG
jgi:hypothetical protein